MTDTPAGAQTDARNDRIRVDEKLLPDSGSPMAQNSTCKSVISTISHAKQDSSMNCR